MDDDSIIQYNKAAILLIMGKTDDAHQILKNGYSQAGLGFFI
jgi:hypothetical protein